MGRIHDRANTVAEPWTLYPRTEINVAVVSGTVGPLLIFELLFRERSELPLPAHSAKTDLLQHSSAQSQLTDPLPPYL